jgi:hypothetical protein
VTLMTVMSEVAMMSVMSAVSSRALVPMVSMTVVRTYADDRSDVIVSGLFCRVF